MLLNRISSEGGGRGNVSRYPTQLCFLVEKVRSDIERNKRTREVYHITPKKKKYRRIILCIKYRPGMGRQVYIDSEVGMKSRENSNMIHP